jgi:hypothetical protein
MSTGFRGGTAAMPYVLAFGCVCACAFAQDATTFRSSVDLVTVPVVVRDKKGNAVGNLKKDDFDQGKPQFISRFSIEESAGESLFVTPRRVWTARARAKK